MNIIVAADDVAAVKACLARHGGEVVRVQNTGNGDCLCLIRIKGDALSLLESDGILASAA
jgi:hypothetical protein